MPRRAERRHERLRRDHGDLGLRRLDGTFGMARPRGVSEACRRDGYQRCLQVLRLVPVSDGRSIRTSLTLPMALQPETARKDLQGPRRAVSMCRFTPDGSYLASVGDSDRCLLQWARRSNGTCVKSKGSLPAPTMNEVPPAPDYIEPEDPSTADASDLVAPSVAPQLSFCYGVPPQANRVGYSTNGDIVLGLGSKGVVYDKSSHTMRFFQVVSEFSFCFCLFRCLWGCRGSRFTVDSTRLRHGDRCPLRLIAFIIEVRDAPRLLGRRLYLSRCGCGPPELADSGDVGLDVRKVGGRRFLCSITDTVDERRLRLLGRPRFLVYWRRRRRRFRGYPILRRFRQERRPTQNAVADLRRVHGRRLRRQYHTGGHALRSFRGVGRLTK